MAKRVKNGRLEIRVKRVWLPPAVTPDQYFRELKKAIHTRDGLPSGWAVTLYWRHPDTDEDWKSGEFTDVVSRAHGGFMTCLSRIIDRASLGIPGGR